jgi:uncharacterized membrane protein YhaH (DUF805 family)
MEWMLMPLKRYAEFSGRSRRKEYWMFVLFSFLINFAFLALMALVGGGAFFAAMSGANPDPTAMMTMGGAVGIIYLVSVIVGLGMLIPSIAVAVRRLHDTNRRGWWLLGPLVPYVVLLFASLGMVGITAGGGATPDTGMMATIGIIAGICGLAVMILGIVLLVFMCLEGTRGPNRFGPDPKNPEANYGEVFS